MLVVDTGGDVQCAHSSRVQASVQFWLVSKLLSFTNVCTTGYYFIPIRRSVE